MKLTTEYAEHANCLTKVDSYDNGERNPSAKGEEGLQAEVDLQIMFGECSVQMFHFL
jgi:hypothetical protein